MTNILKILDEWVIIGRPGYSGKKKMIKRKEINSKFGEGNWRIAHLVEDKLLTRDEALRHFELSYLKYFNENPELLEWLLEYASDVYDTAPSNIESGLDYSIQETEAAHLHDISIRRVVKELSKKFRGEALLQIRGEDGDGYVLTTGIVPFYKPNLILKPPLKGWWKKNSMEAFWQSNKVLAVKFDKLVRMSSPMVGVVLRRDIHMGKGKFSAQTAHAIVSLFPQRNLKWDFGAKPIEIWTVKGEENLLGIHRKAAKMDVNCSIIRDAGKTQLAPGTRTAVGIGPINEAEFDRIMYELDAKPLESKLRSYLSF
ncbi:MAG: peptidyl-tRNA hydrolase, partial [Candidatus Heimdallarchaeota archaeon]